MLLQEILRIIALIGTIIAGIFVVLILIKNNVNIKKEKQKYE